MKKEILTVIIGISIMILIVIGLNSWTTIKPGHVGIGTLFGKVQKQVYEEGFHIINPLLDIEEMDGRQKTHLESMGVPSQDQLITDFELSIQYRLIKEQAPKMKKETGTPQEVISIHMIPFLRSQMRELGKSVDVAEKFYDQSVQQRIQTELLNNLDYLSSKGIKVERVLIRDISLPKVIRDAVERKKKLAQDAEKAKEELKRFKVDQERQEVEALAKKKALLVEANAKLEAAKIEAEATLVRAEAKAEAKRKQISVLGQKGYLQIQMIEGLKFLQDGNHLIILDPNKTNPLPFLNLTQK